MDERNQKFFKTKPRGITQEVVFPDFPDDDTTTTTFTKSRRVSFGTNFIKEFIVGSAATAQCVTEYERAFSSSDSSNANSSHSAIESGFHDKDASSVHTVASEPDVMESRAKIPKISSTICFNADSPTTEMEFTEGCISLAKSILDKKNKDMTVIIQANRKGDDKVGKPEETKIFEGSQFDMSLTKCFKSKENKIEERRFDGNKTKIFSRSDDEISITRCSRIFDTKQTDDSWLGIGEKENQIPLDLIMKHLDKDDSNFENSLFNPESSLNDALKCKQMNVSDEKLYLNESMDISKDSLFGKVSKNDNKLEVLNDETCTNQKLFADDFGKKEEDSFLETLTAGVEKEEEMEITFLKEGDAGAGGDILKENDLCEVIESEKAVCAESPRDENCLSKTSNGEGAAVEMQNTYVVLDYSVNFADKTSKSVVQEQTFNVNSPFIKQPTIGEEPMVHEHKQSDTFLIVSKQPSAKEVEGNDKNQNLPMSMAEEETKEKIDEQTPSDLTFSKTKQPSIDVIVGSVSEEQIVGATLKETEGKIHEHTLIGNISLNMSEQPMIEVEGNVSKKQNLPVSVVEEKTEGKIHEHTLLDDMSLSISNQHMVEGNDTKEQSFLVSGSLEKIEGEPHKPTLSDSSLNISKKPPVAEVNGNVTKEKILSLNTTVEVTKSEVCEQTSIDDLALSTSKQFMVGAEEPKIVEQNVSSLEEAVEMGDKNVEEENSSMEMSHKVEETEEPTKISESILNISKQCVVEAEKAIIVEEQNRLENMLSIEEVVETGDKNINENSSMEISDRVHEVEEPAKIAESICLNTSKQPAVEAERHKVVEEQCGLENISSIQEAVDRRGENYEENSPMDISYEEPALVKEDILESPSKQLPVENLIQEDVRTLTVEAEPAGVKENLIESQEVEVNSKPNELNLTAEENPFISSTTQKETETQPPKPINIEPSENLPEKMEEDIEISTDMSLSKPQHHNDTAEEFMNVDDEKENELVNSNGEVTLTGLMEFEESLEEVNVTGESLPRKTSVETSQLETTCSIMNAGIVKALEEQSTEPGCVWSLEEFKQPLPKSKGLLCFLFNLLDSAVIVTFFLGIKKYSDDWVVVGSNVRLEDQKLRLEDYKTVRDFGFEKFKNKFEEIRAGVQTIHDMSCFLDQMNLYLQKTSPYLHQIHSILRLYPGSKFENPVLTFRLYSYPIFFSCNISIDLSDFFQLSELSLTFDFDFGEIDTKKIAKIFLECLTLDNALCQFVIRSTNYLIELERATGAISIRRHIRLLSMKQEP